MSCIGGGKKINGIKPKETHNTQNTQADKQVKSQKPCILQI